MKHRSSKIHGCGMIIVFLAGILACRAEEPAFGVRRAFVMQSNQRQTDANAPARAGADDELCLEVVNFELWKAAQDPTIRDGELVLYLDRTPVPGLQLVPYPAKDWIEEVRGDGFRRTNQISYFGVVLEQNAANLKVWKKLVRSPNFELTRPMEVSIGFANGKPMHTWVYPLAMPGAQSPFELIILTQGKFYFGIGVIIGALIIFICLARRTDLLRDPNLPLRPDGRMQFSLARTQMAFWFFMVFGAFFFLWLMTRDTDTLNASTITLIGISAGTAVSSAFIDSSKRRSLDDNVVIKNAGETDEDIRKRLRTDLQRISQALKDVKAARACIDVLDTSALEQNCIRRDALEEERGKVAKQVDFFESSCWKAAMHDLLGEDGVISFHRFQMVIWTIVLGIIFVWDVYHNAAMPDFSPTLLGLMGVSAGTFIGFKMPAHSK